MFHSPSLVFQALSSTSLIIALSKAHCPKCVNNKKIVPTVLQLHCSIAKKNTYKDTGLSSSANSDARLNCHFSGCIIHGWKFRVTRVCPVRVGSWNRKRPVIPIWDVLTKRFDPYYTGIRNHHHRRHHHHCHHYFYYFYYYCCCCCCCWSCCRYCCYWCYERK